MISKLILCCAAVLAGAVASSSAFAAQFSFQGTFNNDTDVQLFTFTLATDTPGVVLRTYSYGGGLNAAGQNIPSGGFDTHLSLFALDGSQMNPASVGACAGTPLTADPMTGLCGDTYYPTTLSFPSGIWPAGTYILALTLDANPGVGNLADGFFANAVLGLTSPSNFTCEVGPLGFQGTPPSIPVGNPFCDSVSSPTLERTGAWALDILNVDSAIEGTTVPEPGTLAYGALSLVAIAAAWRLRRTA